MAQSVFPIEAGQKLPGDDCNEKTTGVAPLETLNAVLTRSPMSSLAVRILGLKYVSILWQQHRKLKLLNLQTV